MNTAAPFGERARRREDGPLLTGKGVFLADLIRPGMAALRVVRSTRAHARITHIDFSAVANDPHCLGVLSAATLPEGMGRLPAIDLVEGSLPAHHDILAREVVRYVGEPVAAVIAADAYLAEDLAARVAVGYDSLPPVLNVGEGIRADAPLLYPQFASNVVHQTIQRVGDPEAAFARADLLIEETFHFQRVCASAMEPRGALATLEPGTGRSLVYSSTQIPQILRRELARLTGIPVERLRVIAPQVGGGFGVKEAVYAEEVLVLLALQRFGRPTYWLEDRQESFLASSQGREETLRVRAAVTAAGEVTAVDADCLADIGAAYLFLSNTPGAAVASLRGPYRIANFSSRARSVVTNKTPLNVYRGAGCPQTTLAMERMMDLAAQALGLDRAEIRRRNLIGPDAFPLDRGVSYPGCGRVIFDSGNFPALLESTLEAIDYHGFPARRAAAGERTLGLGLSFVVEMSGGGGAEPAGIRVLPEGRLQLLSGITPIGQGSATTLAQILAGHLGLPLTAIEVLTADTDQSPDAPGTFASRGATLGGNAACLAGDLLIREARQLAATLYELPLEDIRWQNGELIGRAGVPEPLSLAGLITKAQEHGIDALRRLQVSGRYERDAVSWTSACHAAIVDLERDTGIIRVLDYAVTHDCGRIANPLLVDGQIMGGVLQGLGQCLFEAQRFDERGVPLTQGFMDYVLPTAATAPRFILRHIETPSPLNPLGMKGAGEAGCSGAVGAIANAIADALGPQVPFLNGSGPFTPECVLAMLRRRGGHHEA